MAFPADFLDELVARNDIADVVGGYVQLTKKSGSNLFGLCPFHSEKTPSFSVSTDKQIYHCFGCGKGGGVINFVMEVEGLGYRDAVEMLAKRVHARHDSNNPASGAVMKKCGMTYEGTLRKADYNNQGICDMVCYSILRGEYHKN